MNTRAIVDDAVGSIRAIPEKLSGDDSALADPWEEIKEQVQNETSFFWPTYLATMNAIIEGLLDSLSKEDRLSLAAELKVPPEDSERLCQQVLKRLIAKAKREKIRYAPFDFSFFRYSIDDMSIFVEVLERTGLATCRVRAYSRAAPSGETGEVYADVMEATMTREQFERARQQGWPEKWDGA